MAITVFKAVARAKDGIKIECDNTRGHKIVMDEPQDLGGTDTGMNPVEAVLCALGACQSIVAKAFAGMQGIDIEDFWVEVEGDLDPDGFQGVNPNVRPGIQSIRTKMHIKSNAPEDKIKEYVEFIEKTCPVGDTIQNAAKITNNYVIEK
ncbi:hydroperoxide reductase [Clostridium acetireducens DSM 10703]|jgi:uncharacterized OsmC-like protein|uniref:Hydroperoxide reductase n=1 Tax=Clostridium acetireducens DSM 10703 TaxID=1121290 RepID=A0A1E8EY72_9CLOT|nr:OsmC family protein [Clostridium acetireducens]OFI05906.1 hydroperoxide reductase [Clostridium acetireducens DSM 10703]